MMLLTGLVAASCGMCNACTSIVIDLRLPYRMPDKQLITSRNRNELKDPMYGSVLRALRSRVEGAMIKTTASAEGLSLPF